MISQIRRAALSVHLNVAEGCSRKSEKERKRYYEIARGSIIEVDAALDIAVSLDYTSKEKLGELGQLDDQEFSNDFKTDFVVTPKLSSTDSRLTIHEILKQYWGFESFRPLQEDIIESVLNGKDTLAIMPTGGGKSLCYQVPALVKEGICLVISPLIALMKDQVENLRKKNITAFAIYSGMSRKEVINTLKVVTESNCKFLYVSPERLETALFKEYLPGMLINLIAVDEAHCISQWGYDFRPPYLRIAALRKELANIPVLALTASATPEVQNDICDKLKPTPASPNPSEGGISRSLRTL